MTYEANVSHLFSSLLRSSDVVKAGESALHAAYLAGFKDGLLLAIAVFSILFLLFRRGE
jgi:hypothetical protein